MLLLSLNKLFKNDQCLLNYRRFEVEVKKFVPRFSHLSFSILRAALQ